jgi:sugar lactone lactonase YvrE
MYFKDGGEIRRANLDGSGQVTLISGLNAFGPTLDLAGGQMYWAEEDAGEIKRANLDGSGQTTLVSGLPPDSTLPSFTPPVLDLAHGQMYWTDGINSGPGDIRRANLDGSEQTVLVTGLSAPRGLALDPAGGQMYWAEGGASGKIWRANLDGSGVMTLLQVAPGPFAVALDIAGGKIYFARLVAGDIQRANFDGSGQEILVHNPDPDGIALDLAGGKMYWTNLLNGDIRRANLDGSGEEILIQGLSLPGFIALDLGAPGTAAYFAVAAPASVPSGTPFDVTITALDPYGNTAVNYQGTVTFSTSDTDPGIVLPADYTFTAADAGVHTFTGGVTLITSGDQTITATDTASGITRTVTVTVGP